MTKTSLVALSVMGLMTHCSINASSQVPHCAESIFPKLNLRQTSCNEQDGVETRKYSGSEPTSPYATEFDRRQVVIAKSADTAKLQQVVGLKVTGQTLKMPRIQLVTPPFEDQISQRKSMSKPERRNGWVIVTERIQYAAQGGRPGFVMDCSTAVHRRKKDSAAVAECFPLEERDRFLHTLDSVR